MQCILITSEGQDKCWCLEIVVRTHPVDDASRLCAGEKSGLIASCQQKTGGRADTRLRGYKGSKSMLTQPVASTEFVTFDLQSAVFVWLFRLLAMLPRAVTIYL